MCVPADELKRAKTKMANLNFDNERLIDVVNEKDEVVDSKSRIEVHRLGLLHRQIHVWMFDADKNIYFQKRGVDRPSAGLLDATVGGHTNRGEKYIEAAIRETQEETGLSIEASDLILLKKIKHKDNRQSKSGLSGVINNYIGYIYIYKKPIKEGDLKKELGIPGGGFRKLSYNFLLNPDKEYIPLFLPFVFKEELPFVIEYLK